MATITLTLQFSDGSQKSLTAIGDIVRITAFLHEHYSRIETMDRVFGRIRPRIVSISASKASDTTRRPIKTKVMA